MSRGTPTAVKRLSEAGPNIRRAPAVTPELFLAFELFDLDFTLSIALGDMTTS
ncbi:MAG: hypothetical protein ACRECV_15085 [Xanthobacteraceae bacterium]